MARRPKFELIFAPEAVDHLKAIEHKYYSLIEKTLDEQLGFTPGRVTRNRKSLEQPAPFDATWELRFDPNNRFRVFYEIDVEEKIVWILAIGFKDGNRLIVGKEEIEP
jgi:mRNA-degrading endonuclease RelE of RelBE toxin-antitoxin system